MKHAKLLLAASTSLLMGSQSFAAKNIILMISDGAGYSQWEASSYYRGQAGAEIYEGDAWVHYPCSTYMAHDEALSPSGAQLEDLIYDPSKIWNANEDVLDDEDSSDDLFEGYEYIKSTATDSAAAASAISMGRKTFKYTLNWTNYPEGQGTPATGQTIAEIAHNSGRAVGTVSSVQFFHATPAGLGGVHNFYRKNYQEISRELMECDWLDVVIGPGHPYYNNDGVLQAEGNFNSVDESDWAALVAGEKNAYSFVDSKDDFLSIASGSGELPSKLFGVPQVASTLQQSRSGLGGDDNTKEDAYAVALNDNVPDLGTLSLAALNVLNQDEDGFFLHIEGGAIDWAGHGNQPGRIIEEQDDFVNAVEQVCAWVEENSSWEETLVIITADHETGLLLGPDADTEFFDAVVDNGAGNMPGMSFFSGGHTNQLVPVYARGAEADNFRAFANNYDPVHGVYVDNTNIFDVMKAVVVEEVTGDERAKYVFLMISDGAGYNMWDAASMYEGKWNSWCEPKDGQQGYGIPSQEYNAEGWMHLACTTYMDSPYHEHGSGEVSGYQMQFGYYDSEEAWATAESSFLYEGGSFYPLDDAALDSASGYFDGYNWIRKTPTDSAAAATAIATGVKTYKGSLNVDVYGNKMMGQTLAELAHYAGKKVGSISSVQWSHATPAGLAGAHNSYRSNYSEVANEILDCDWVDVIMGAGNPEFDGNGDPLTPSKESDWKYVGGQETWEALKAGNHEGEWSLIQDISEFEALANGDVVAIPSRLCGTAKSKYTIQQGRSGADDDTRDDDVYEVIRRDDVPSLATMTQAAINVLKNDNQRGFFLHVEGGAIDWSGHANQMGRIVEEQIDFNEAVNAVIEWVEDDANDATWENTLVIVTADHETGLMMGPDSATEAYDLMVDQGEGNMPEFSFNSGQHTNQLVPVYTRGPGANLFNGLVDGRDPVRGDYVDNTDIYIVAANAMKGTSGSNYICEDAITLGGGWKHSEAFGYFYDSHWPWVYFHGNKGWTYFSENDCNADHIWFWSDSWFFTAQEFYPWCWSHDEQEWQYLSK